MTKISKNISLSTLQRPDSRYKHPSDFRVLFVYPNMQMSALAPQGIGYLSSMLKRDGFTVDLFDTTFYQSDLTGDYHKEKIYMSNARPYDWKEKGIQPKTTNMLEDFQRQVDEFQPDLLAVSVVENNWYIAENLLESLRQRVPAIVGGVFATYAPEIVISHPRVDYVCRGEGELAFSRLCNALADGGDVTQLPNIWAKVDGNIHRNPIGQAIDLDELPFPDWSLFEEQSLYRPMQGRIYKTIGIETQRGCPYRCTFCNSPSNDDIYNAETGDAYFRKKSVKRIAQELEYMSKNFAPEFIYFVVDTFLTLGDREFEDLADMYQDYKIPFWMNTRAETINEWRAEQLDRMNCLRVNIGIEHGNEKFRREVLDRRVTNEKMLEAFNACAGRNFVTCANSIIGFPDETRDLIFNTIEFNRQLPKEIEATGAFLFTPYHGLPLRDIAIQRGYLDPDTICSVNVTKGSILEMPHISSEDLQGISRVFSFYVKMPKQRFSDISIAESFSDKGEIAFSSLREEFQRSYSPSTVNPKDVSSFDLVQDQSGLREGGEFSDLHG